MPLDFKEKLGPLPVWAWGLIGGGVIVAGYYLVNRGGTSDAESTVTRLDEAGYQTAGITGGSATSDVSAVYDTNALWLNRAAKQTAELAAASVTDVYNALKKFLSGETLTAKEKEYVDIATRNTGVPPEETAGISPVLPAPPPASSKTYFYYVTDKKVWSLIFPSGTIKNTRSQAVANAWAIVYGNAIKVSDSEYRTKLPRGSNG